MPLPQALPTQPQQFPKQCAPQYLPEWETTTAAMMTTTQNPVWVLPRTMMMNQWQQPPHKDAGARIKPKKTKPPTKGGKMTRAENERKRTNACIAKISDKHAPTRTPPMTSVSGKKLQRTASPLDLRRIGSRFQTQVKVQRRLGRMA